MMARHKPTLLEIIETHGEEYPDDPAFTYSDDPVVTYSALQQGIHRVASLLLQKGVAPEDRVLIAIPNSAEFFFAFYGTIKAGAIAVPVSPDSGHQRMVTLARLCDGAFIITSKKFPIDFTKEPGAELTRHSTQSGVRHLDVETPSDSNPDQTFPVIKPDDVAFIQFTSGSTGDPKGVQVTHDGLIINIEQMIQGMEITREDIFVSWLPVFHDMGLILMTMVPFYFGNPFFLLPIGIRYLKVWLETIENEKATFTAAPDFMYRLTMLYIKDPETYDLSTLRTALNAAEPVRATTIRKFETLFRLNNVLLPAYGLAEATVGVSCWYPGKQIEIDKKGHISVGPPFPGIKIRIDHETDTTGGQDIGEILVQSPANTLGYFKNPGADSRLFTKDNYIRTGDLGYVDKDGSLTVVGRKKNIIIQGGITISSREVEELIDLFPFVRRSAAAGIDIKKAQGEQVHIFVEVKFSKSEWLSREHVEEKKILIVRAFHHHFGFRPGRVIFLKPRAIPMTMNGKTQYPALIKQFLSGILG